MYYWSINRLKADLLGKGLEERDKLTYLTLLLIAVSAAYVGVPAHNYWSGMWAVVFTGSIILGAYLCYRWNGGADGQDFLSRFVSLAWVCSIRWSILFVIPIVALTVSLPETNVDFVIPVDPERPPFTRMEIILEAFIVPPLFWRVAANMRDLAHRSANAEEETEFIDEPGLEPLEE